MKRFIKNEEKHPFLSRVPIGAIAYIIVVAALIGALAIIRGHDIDALKSRVCRATAVIAVRSVGSLSPLEGRMLADKYHINKKIVPTIPSPIAQRLIPDPKDQQTVIKLTEENVRLVCED